MIPIQSNIVPDRFPVWVCVRENEVWFPKEEPAYTTDMYHEWTPAQSMEDFNHVVAHLSRKWVLSTWDGSKRTPQRVCGSITFSIHFASTPG